VGYKKIVVFDRHIVKYLRNNRTQADSYDGTLIRKYIHPSKWYKFQTNEQVTENDQMSRQTVSSHKTKVLWEELNNSTTRVPITIYNTTKMPDHIIYTNQGYCRACRKLWGLADSDLCARGVEQDNVPHSGITSPDEIRWQTKENTHC